MIDYKEVMKRHPELDESLIEEEPEIIIDTVARKFPFLEGAHPSGFWYAFRGLTKKAEALGLLELYDSVDRRLQHSLLILLYQTSATKPPRDVILYLLPYGKFTQRIDPYLSRLMHGRVMGFMEAAVVQVDGKNFFYATLQTDLMRKGMDLEKGKQKYIIPPEPMKIYADGTEGEKPWDKMFLEAVEPLLNVDGIEGIVIPTFETISAQVGLRSLHSRRTYDNINYPQQRELVLHFPLNFGNPEEYVESGIYWVKEK